MEELQYHEQRDLKNKKKLQELLAALPPFCADFFRGIEPATSSMTRLSYAYDISTFFDFLRKLKIVCRKYFPGTALRSYDPGS